VFRVPTFKSTEHCMGSLWLNIKNPCFTRGQRRKKLCWELYPTGMLQDDSIFRPRRFIIVGRLSALHPMTAKRQSDGPKTRSNFWGKNPINTWLGNGDIRNRRSVRNASRWESPNAKRNTRQCSKEELRALGRSMTENWQNGSVFLRRLFVTNATSWDSSLQTRRSLCMEEIRLKATRDYPRRRTCHGIGTFLSIHC
jgi:hypothetical protein